MTTIEQIKKELGISNSDIAEFFGFKNTTAYNTSSAKKRYDNGLCAFYDKIKEAEAKANTTDTQGSSDTSEE